MIDVAAVEAQELEVVVRLIKLGANPLPALAAAVWKEDEEIVFQLISDVKVSVRSAFVRSYPLSPVMYHRFALRLESSSSILLCKRRTAREGRFLTLLRNVNRP